MPAMVLGGVTLLRSADELMSWRTLLGVALLGLVVIDAFVELRGIVRMRRARKP